MCVCPERKREREPDEEGEGAEGGVDREGEGGGEEVEKVRQQRRRHPDISRPVGPSVGQLHARRSQLRTCRGAFIFPFFLIRLNRTSFHLQVFTLQDYCSPSRTIF